MLVIDAGFGVATVFASGSVVGEVVMVPIDAGAAWTTDHMWGLVFQGTTHNCDDIHF